MSLELLCLIKTTETKSNINTQDLSIDNPLRFLDLNFGLFLASIAAIYVTMSVGRVLYTTIGCFNFAEGQ